MPLCNTVYAVLTVYSVHTSYSVQYVRYIQTHFTYSVNTVSSLVLCNAVLYREPRTLHSVHCTLYTVQCTIYTVHCKMFTVQVCRILQYILTSTYYHSRMHLYRMVHCTLCIDQCTLHSVHYSLYSVHCTEYFTQFSIHVDKSPRYIYQQVDLQCICVGCTLYTLQDIVFCFGKPIISGECGSYLLCCRLRCNNGNAAA